MSIEISLLIAGLGCASAIYFGLKNSRRNDVSDIKEEATKDAIINVKLDGISTDVKDIKYDITETKKRVEDLDRRVVIVEQSAKSAHHRLDDLIGGGKEDKKKNA